MYVHIYTYSKEKIKYSKEKIKYSKEDIVKKKSKEKIQKYS